MDKFDNFELFFNVETQHLIAITYFSLMFAPLLTVKVGRSSDTFEREAEKMDKLDRLKFVAVIKCNILLKCHISLMFAPSLIVKIG